MSIPSRVRERMVSGLKRLVPIVNQQKTRDVSEADTVTLVKDILAEVFGYDKYSDLTSEFAIRGTYCDLAIKMDDKLSQLVEVKAIGIPLDDRHVKQAVDYAANQGVEWVILTNSIAWRLFHVIFAKPIDKRLILEMDLTAVDWKREEQLERLYLFSKEGVRKGAHVALRDKQDATSRFMVAAVLIYNESVLDVVRRELRRVVDVNVDHVELAEILRTDVIKREALEGPSAEEAAKRVSKKEDRRLRSARASEPAEEVADPEETPPAGSPQE